MPFLTAFNEINHLIRTVDQEVGGSSPPSCTREITCCAYHVRAARLARMRTNSTRRGSGPWLEHDTRVSAGLPGLTSACRCRVVLRIIPSCFADASRCGVNFTRMTVLHNSDSRRKTGLAGHIPARHVASKRVNARLSVVRKLAYGGFGSLKFQIRSRTRCQRFSSLIDERREFQWPRHDP